MSATALAMLLAAASPALAQSALAAAGVDPSRLPPESRLTLRPEAGLEPVALKIARVLALRSDTSVEVGAAPPPILLEAVPAGHLALAHDADGVRLVLGAALGTSFETTVHFAADGEIDPRSLALAVEALRDRAIEARERREALAGSNANSAGFTSAPQPPSRIETWPTGVEPTETETVAAVPEPAPIAPPPAAAAPSAAPAPLVVRARDDGSGELLRPTNDHVVRVVPSLFARAYAGGSPQSNSLRTGLGIGGGLCVLGQCLRLSIDYPLPLGLEAGGTDFRYRYTTFGCGFFSQLGRYGAFSPAVSVSLLSRVGHFERDMGITNARNSLETDLGVRGGLEAAFEVFDSVDLLAEAGLDYALDRWQLGHGDSVAYRGPRTTPWLQGGFRFRPY